MTKSLAHIIGIGMLEATILFILDGRDKVYNGAIVGSNLLKK
jgi:hypothetical protein